MNQKIEKIKEILRANSSVKFAYLFGSRAKGIADKKSDWDIAIYFRKDPQKLSKWTVFSLEAELSKEIGNEVQITVLNNLDSPVFYSRL